jgi:hypothetical protein
VSAAPFTLVCFAVKEEAKPFTHLIGSNPKLRTLLTGIGPRNADRTIRAALAPDKPERVLTSGFAGGLRPDLAAMTVVFSADKETGWNPPCSPPAPNPCASMASNA